MESLNVWNHKFYKANDYIGIWINLYICLDGHCLSLRIQVIIMFLKAHYMAIPHINQV